MAVKIIMLKISFLICENFPNVNYEYIRYPYDQTYKDYSKLDSLISKVKTPYFVLGQFAELLPE